MPIDASQSSLLAKLQSRRVGAYDKVKNVEAKPGGRVIPGKLKGAIGQITGCKIAESEGEKTAGEVYVYVYARCIEPDAHFGLPQCSQIYMLAESQWSTYEDNLSNLLRDLKLLGYSEQIDRCETEADLYGKTLPFILDDLDKRKPYFVFDTSARPKNDGTFNAHIQGLPPAGYQPKRKLPDNEHENKGYQPVQPQQSATTGVPPTSAPGKPGPKPGPAKPGSPQKPGAQRTVQIGDRAKMVHNCTGDGNQWEGKVEAIDAANNKIYLSFGDDDKFDFPLDKVESFTPASGPPAAAPGFRPGMECKTEPNFFKDGTSYPCVIISMNGENARVRYHQDNTESDLPLSALIPV